VGKKNVGEFRRQLREKGEKNTSAKLIEDKMFFRTKTRSYAENHQGSLWNV